MDSVTIENFRCFRERQTARLSHLSLLVGDNSTGKTSLMALVPILWRAILFGEYRPSFEQEPFDPGSFWEIVHQSDNDGHSGEVFSGGLTFGNTKCEATFRQGRISPEVSRLHIDNSEASIDLDPLPGWSRQSCSQNLKRRMAIHLRRTRKSETGRPVNAGL